MKLNLSKINSYLFGESIHLCYELNSIMDNFVKYQNYLIYISFKNNVSHFPLILSFLFSLFIQLTCLTY